MAAWIHVVFAIALIGLAVGLAGEHLRVWRNASRRKLDDAEHRFLFRQYQRRIRTAQLIALVGILVGVGVFVRSERAVAIYWSGVGLLVLGLLVLAALDWSSSFQYYNSLLGKATSRRDELLAEVQRRRAASANGDGGKPHREQGTNDHGEAS